MYFISHFSLKDQLYDTVINMFALKNSAPRFAKVYQGTSPPCREIDWHVFGLCTINCIRINKKTILSLAGVAFNS